MTVVYNEQARPRAVVAGCTEEHPVAQAAAAAVGFLSCEAMNRHPPHERDVVIVWQKVVSSGNTRLNVGGDGQRHLRVLQFGGDPASTFSMGIHGSPGPVLSRAVAGELMIPETCPPPLRSLVKRTLIPLLASRSSERTVLRSTWGNDSMNTRFEPLVMTSNGNTLAAIYSHPNIQEVWYLPVLAQDVDFDFAAWIEAAMLHWHEQDATRFPGPPDWTRSKDWMTHEELELQKQVEIARTELEQRVAELTTEVEARELALTEARDRHNREERILLTGQGEELVDAVHDMLHRLDFDVVDVDKERAAEDLKSGSTRPKLEDLRVTDPETSWRALAEVKGYVGGGKTSDFQKINRFVGIYQVQNGSPPDAVWYVVNQFLDRPPNQRPLLMGGQAEDVEVFAQTVNGVLVDTRDLFAVARLVAAGELTKAEARRMLMDAQRRFSRDGQQQPPAQPDEAATDA